MNRGTMRGITWQTLPSDATYPEMKVKWVPYVSSYEFGSGEVDTLVLVDSSTAVTVELNGANIREGQCIHIAQWGTQAVTVTNSDGILRCSGTAATRAQYSVVTAMLISSKSNEWLVFGDITV